MSREPGATRRLTGLKTNASADVQVFIHVHCAKQWRAILQEQFQALVFSGLLERASAVHVVFNVLDRNQSLGAVTKLANIYGAKVNTTFHLNTTSYERVTLYSISDHITPDTRFLYIHSKGVRHGPENVNVLYWRRYMEYFLIRHWETCLCMLDSGQWDSVGVNLRPGPLPWPAHYNGNFWWTTGAFWLAHHRYIDDFYPAPEFHLLAGLLDANRRPRPAKLAESLSLGIDLYGFQLMPRHYRQVSLWADAEAVGCRRQDALEP